MTQVIKTATLPNHVMLPYVEQGDHRGTPVVFLHAVADSWRAFEPVLAHLPASIHAFAMTQRGHGDASKPQDGYRPEDFAEDLTAFMDVVGVDAAVLVGGSSGGFTARRSAIDHPERTLGLVLLGSPYSLRDKPGVQDLLDSTLSVMTDLVDPALAREFVQGTLARPVAQAMIDIFVAENLKAPARVWKATIRGVLDETSTTELDKITAPTLIIWGDKDAFLPRDDQERLHEAIPNSRLIVHEGAGHALYWEDPARVAADLTAFVADIAS